MLRLHFSRMRRDIAKDVRTERVRRRRINSEKPEDKHTHQANDARDPDG